MGLEYFSRRHGFGPEDRPIETYDDAPRALRAATLQISEEVGLRPSTMREVVCRILREAPDPGNWSDYPNVWQEVMDLVLRCPWYKVYDIIEGLYAEVPSPWLRRDGPNPKEVFTREINAVLVENGVGWKLENGQVEIRGSVEYEELIHGTLENTEAEGPDNTGSIQHALAALECMARIVSDEEQATLGQLVSRYHDSLDLRPPLDDVVHKLWGFSSEYGRHLREGRTPTRREARLVVGIAVVLVSHLAETYNDAI